jgi:DNA invertase Pin-like site-specific DNA recombinase
MNIEVITLNANYGFSEGNQSVNLKLPLEQMKRKDVSYCCDINLPSLQQQYELVDGMAKRFGFPQFDDSYVDSKSSVDNRKEYRQMLEDIKAGKIRSVFMVRKDICLQSSDEIKELEDVSERNDVHIFTIEGVSIGEAYSRVMKK